jgi:endonuclease/exonuclease/phosphatase family metal-dependent hydrolase
VRLTASWRVSGRPLEILCDPQQTQQKTENDMRVLSYNIHKGIGGRDRRYRLERVLSVIEDENPDLICLQEVDRDVPRSRCHNQPKLFADHFNSVARLYQTNVRLKQGGYGNLILSRWRLRSKHQVSLRYNSKKPRGAQMVVVETPEGLLQLVNWHLGLAEQERHWQVKHLLHHHLFRESEHLPTLIIGDFNDWRNTLAGGPFQAADFQQVTAPASRFRSFPAYLPMGALDKAFVRGAINIRRAHVVRNRAAAIASDHLPLVVDFHLGRNAKNDKSS